MTPFSDLQLVIFRPPVSVADRDRYEAAYSFWRSIWIEANTEMVRPTNFPSDPFTRQSEILCLFRGDAPVALICHRHCDFNANSSYDDSTFFPGTWRDEDKKFVRDLGGVGLMGSQITILPNERGTREDGFSMKTLIVLLSLAHAQAQGVETVVASIRTAKGLDKLFGKAGCLMIAPARPFFGASVDLIAFRTQVAPIQIQDEYRMLVKNLLSKAQVSNPLQFSNLNKSSNTTERKSA